eukprot:TCONS_00015986-protein
MAVKMEGPLTKWTNVVQGWQYRWFVLDDHTGLLSYYTSKDRMMRGARRGCLRLKGGVVGINDEDDSTFTITCDHRTFHFQAQDSEERRKWVKNLEETILKHSGDGILSSFDNASMTEEELNRKMQEAEAYFRILTQQVKKMESQINHSSNMKAERSFILKDSLTQMIETMGQTIELLHNAKTSLAKKVPVPVLDNQSQSPVDISDSTIDSSSSPVLPDTDASSSLNDSTSPVHLVVSSSSGPSGNSSADADIVEEACEVTETTKNDINTQQALTQNNTQIPGPVQAPDVDTPTINQEPAPTFQQPAPSLSFIETVPISSYTSSDEEDEGDEFFDAEEEIAVDDIENSLKLEEEALQHMKNQQHDNGILDMNDAIRNEGLQRQRTESTKSKTAFSDEEYDIGRDDEDDEEADMSSHGSVISHLISQVKIGMDLTKVTLPTFILERRSLLEMYADFFAHPDLFKGIPDLDDAGDRMLQVLKWYLSSFHAGRKSTVAKKPYNPILGETFQCFFDLTDDPNYGKDEVRYN